MNSREGRCSASGSRLNHQPDEWMKAALEGDCSTNRRRTSNGKTGSTYRCRTSNKKNDSTYRRRTANRRTGRRSRKRKKLKTKNLVIFTVFLSVIAAVSFAAITAHYSTNVYQNPEEFREFADGELQKTQNFSVSGDVSTEYDYSSPVSFAYQHDDCSITAAAALREQKITEIKQQFIDESSEAEAVRKQKAEKERHLYRPAERALLLKSSVYRSSGGAVSLAIYDESSCETGKDMKRTESHIHTYQFSAETGSQLEAMQIFRENFSQVCSSYLTDYFRRQYKKSELKKDWQNYVTADESNFTEYTLTDEGVTFYFDEGTILKKSKGIICAGIPASELGDVLRESILERYTDPAKPMVALTFDDGPGGEAETRILECLKSNGAVATFFYLGNRVYTYPDNVKTARDIGCEIGSHSWNHPLLTKLTAEELSRQFSDTNAAVKDVSGAYPTVFRPCYGETNETVNSLSGLPVIMWTVDTLDWKNKDGQKIFESVSGASNLDGRIILMHSIYGTTADAVELIVPWLKANGYQTVTVSELIKYKTGSEPQAGNVYRTF